MAVINHYLLTFSQVRCVCGTLRSEGSKCGNQRCRTVQLTKLESISLLEQNSSHSRLYLRNEFAFPQC